MAGDEGVKKKDKPAVAKKAKEKPGVEKRPEPGVSKDVPVESLEHLKHQKEEIETLLSSLEDAYYEASILEDDYNKTRQKNQKRLEEIESKIKAAEEKVKKDEAKKAAEALKEVKKESSSQKATPGQPAVPPAGAAPPAAQAAPPSIDFEELENNISEKVKGIVSGIETKISQKDAEEIRKKLSKFSMDIEKLKASVETIKEFKGAQDEKVQRALENVSELRSIIFQRETMMKDQETKMQKVSDQMSQIEPEKIMMALGKRDRQISDHDIKLDKIEGKMKNVEEIFERLKHVISNIGSLENMINMGKESTEKLNEMRGVQTGIQKLSDKMHGLYADLSSRLEEFDIYKRKQDRSGSLVESLMSSVDDINKKMNEFVTREDMESLKLRAASSGAAPSGGSGIGSLLEEKEEVEMLLNSLEESKKASMISKKEYEKTKKMNQQKLADLEKQIKEAKSPGGGGGAPSPAAKAPGPSKVEEEKDEGSPHMSAIEDAFKKGLISKKSYQKVKKIILGK